MESAGEHKPSPYMLVWGVLFFLTVFEVLFAFQDGRAEWYTVMDIPKVYIAVGLIIMAFWKALLVAVYYMHLRFEPKRLWVLVASPIPLILILLLVVLKEY